MTDIINCYIYHKTLNKGIYKIVHGNDEFLLLRRLLTDNVLIRGKSTYKHFIDKIDYSKKAVKISASETNKKRYLINPHLDFLYTVNDKVKYHYNDTSFYKNKLIV